MSCYCAANALLELASDQGLLNYELRSADLLTPLLYLHRGFLSFFAD